MHFFLSCKVSADLLSPGLHWHPESFTMSLFSVLSHSFPPQGHLMLRRWLLQSSQDICEGGWKQALNLGTSMQPKFRNFLPYQRRKGEWILVIAILIFNTMCLCACEYIYRWTDGWIDRCIKKFRASNGGIVKYMQFFWGCCRCSFKKSHMYKF